jgi:NAD+ diphosphatase
MLNWHRRHGFCSVCGAATASREAGHVRRCTDPDCGAHCFPRTDPAVIMLVHDGGDRVVLGRKASMLPGQHSILAGFVEPGESLEDAVRREVFEEVGLELGEVIYHSSQPWPFPANIMLGFTARATTFDLNVDYNELEDGARWFTRDFLRSSPEDESFRLPRRDSISRRLVNEWLEE